ESSSYGLLLYYLQIDRRSHTKRTQEQPFKEQNFHESSPPLRPKNRFSLKNKERKAETGVRITGQRPGNQTFQKGLESRRLGNPVSLPRRQIDGIHERFVRSGNTSADELRQRSVTVDLRIFH